MLSLRMRLVESSLMGARPHFHVAGIPVRIEPVFWIMTVLLAFNLNDARLIIMWVGVVLVSILVHELGHAVALKAYGQASSIVLHGFGGLTISQRRLSKIQSIVVSLAGPLTALALLGIPAYLLRESDYGLELFFDWDGGFGLWPILYFVVYVNIWWSIANLLPIRPLDGGNVMTELIGIQRARILSVVVGGAAAVWAYFYAESGFRYAAFFAAFLAFINFAEHRRARMGQPAPSTFDVEAPSPPGGGRRPAPGSTGRPRARRAGRPTGPPTRTPEAVTPIPGGVDPASAESFAWNLLRSGDAAGARRVLQRATGPVGPFVHATVTAASGGGSGSLVEAYLTHPAGPSNLVPATVLAETGQSLEVAQQLVNEGAAGREAAGSLQTHLHYAERFADAAAVGEALYESAGAARAQVAFDVACSWARSGAPDRSVEWVRRAIDAGFAAPSVLDGEPDLAAARAHPAWSEVRSRLH